MDEKIAGMINQSSSSFGGADRSSDIQEMEQHYETTFDTLAEKLKENYEEDIDAVCHAAGELGVLGVPVFAFHEGGNPVVARAFKQIATLTRGAYCPFDLSSADRLKELLAAVAVYAAGGRQALLSYGAGRGEAVRVLTSQVRG